MNKIITIVLVFMLMIVSSCYKFEENPENGEQNNNVNENIENTDESNENENNIKINADNNNIEK